jgi:hypothetical protein
MITRIFRLSFALFICLYLLQFVGCGTSSTARKHDSPSAKTQGTVNEMPRFNLTGIWRSPVCGVMKLRQSGNKVTGTYECNDGQIKGTVEGNRFKYSWWEKARGRSYKQAFKTHRGNGYFIISKNGKKLTGKWRTEDSKKWGGSWSFSWRSDWHIRKIK